MHPFRRVVPALASLALAAASAFAAPWDEPFRATPAELLGATRDLPTRAGDGVAVLLEEGRHSYDAGARGTRTYRLVYRILDDDGIAGWGSIDAVYEPWRSAAPALRARVIAPDGSVRELDPKTIDEAPAHDDLPDVLTSARVLRAPLPGLTPGCVVESQMSWTDEAPLVPGAAGGQWSFGFGVPVAETRVTVDAPASLHVTFVPRLFAGTPERSEKDGRVTTTWRMIAMPRFEPPVMLLAPEIPRAPRVAWTTAASWGALAEAYASIVDRQAVSEDVAEAARAAAGDAKDVPVAAARCLAWIHERVRYTGLEFGEAAIVPARPKECLTRGYGDCKDKATLLVAMMRSLGHRADVALLAPGALEDIDADVPLLGVFSHAIAAVGDPPLFIDATVPEAAVGELPDLDQGRLALVARHGATGLVRTPASSPATDRVLENVEVVLAEDGRGQVTKTSQSWGRFAVDHRQAARGRTDKDLKEGLDSLCETEWMAKETADIVSSGASDLASPTRLSYSIKEAGRTHSEWPVAMVAMPPGGWLDRLAFLAEDDDKTPTEEQVKRKEREAARTEPAQLPGPFSWERRYHVVPPPGYAVETIPVLPSWKAGPVSLTSEAKAADDGSVTVSIRFDTGTGRLQPSELADLRSRITKASGADHPVMIFHAIAQRRLADGDVKGALGELRRLAALHPAEALHHVHLAQVLLVVGLGDAARKEADAAVAAEPASARAHAARAIALTHDALGREFGKGSDLPAAIAELRKAKELDPKNEDVRRDLAGLVGKLPNGQTNWDAKASREAADEWRSLEKDLDLKDAGVRAELAAALLRAGDPKAATDAALEWTGKRDVRLDALGLAGIALTSGVAEAARRATTAPFHEHDRSRLLQTAAMALVQGRRYAEAADVYAEAAKGSGNAAELGAQADRTRSIKVQDAGAVNPDEPAGIVTALMLGYFNENADAVMALFSDDILGGKSRDEALAEFTEGLRGPRAALKSTNMPQAVLLDTILSLIRVTSDSDGADGARVVMRFPDAKSDTRSVLYARREKKGWRIVGLDRMPQSLGGVAFDHAAAGRDAVARRWLDWAADSSDASEFMRTVFAPVWTRGQEAANADIRLAAAILSDRPDPGGEVTRTLLDGRERAASDEQRRRIDLALIGRYLANEQHDKMLELARKMSASETSLGPATLGVMAALRALKREPEILPMLEDLHRRHPDDDDVGVALAQQLMVAGRLAQALSTAKAIEARGNASAALHNNIAWMGLLAGEPAETLLEDARAGAADGAATSLHTLAAVLAEASRPVEARQILLESLERRADDQPQSHDWYVLGRIAEGYGETDAARDAFTRSLPPDGKDKPDDSSVLARRRLAGLGKPAPAKAG